MAISVSARLDRKAALCFPGMRIVCAAIKNAQGSVICSARHFDGLMRAQIAIHSEDGWQQAEQGFVDQRGGFWTRKEAYLIAKAAGQIFRRVGGDDKCLYSENLY